MILSQEDECLHAIGLPITIGFSITPFLLLFLVLESEARHLSIFGWLLKCKLRDDSNYQEIVKAMLPEYPDQEYVLSQRKPAVALLHRLRQIVAHTTTLPLAAQLSLERNIWELNRMYGRCERVKGSCIPPLYTAHVTRLLVFYIFFLPFALATAGIAIFPNMFTTGSVSRFPFEIFNLKWNCIFLTMSSLNFLTGCLCHVRIG